jgi:Zn finger protein HypA/HybF involved in hydrogenase expression
MNISNHTNCTQIMNTLVKFDEVDYYSIQKLKLRCIDSMCTTGKNTMLLYLIKDIYFNRSHPENRSICVRMNNVFVYDGIDFIDAGHGVPALIKIVNSITDNINNLLSGIGMDIEGIEDIIIEIYRGINMKRYEDVFEFIKSKSRDILTDPKFKIKVVENKYTCDDCGEVFKYKSVRTNHACPKGVCEYKCKWCFESFSTNHMSTKHKAACKEFSLNTLESIDYKCVIGNGIVEKCICPNGTIDIFRLIGFIYFNQSYPENRILCIKQKKYGDDKYIYNYIGLDDIVALLELINYYLIEAIEKSGGTVASTDKQPDYDDRLRIFMETNKAGINVLHRKG